MFHDTPGLENEILDFFVPSVLKIVTAPLTS